MQTFQKTFIELCIQHKVLKFGQFTLKSGRVSPYFFNAGLFNTGASLKALGQAYAQAITDSSLEFDMLFGPAYKGIPLVSSVAMALADKMPQLGFAFNRKEAKDHGEGGIIVGQPLSGRVLILDDVITAGTAFREAYSLIEASGAQVAGIVVALNRQERGQKSISAIEEIQQTYNIPVISVVTLADILSYIKFHENFQQHFSSLTDYRAQYGV